MWGSSLTATFCTASGWIDLRHFYNPHLTSECPWPWRVLWIWNYSRWTLRPVTSPSPPTVLYCTRPSLITLLLCFRLDLAGPPVHLEGELTSENISSLGFAYQREDRLKLIYSLLLCNFPDEVFIVFQVSWPWGLQEMYISLQKANSMLKFKILHISAQIRLYL